MRIATTTIVLPLRTAPTSIVLIDGIPAFLIAILFIVIIPVVNVTLIIEIIETIDGGELRLEHKVSMVETLAISTVIKVNA